MGANRRLLLLGGILAILSLGGATWWCWPVWGQEIGGRTPAERVQAIARVVEQGGSRAGAKLAAAAVNEKDPAVRQAALVGLARFVAPEHRAVIDQCAADPSALVRSGAATTLGLYGDESAADRLRDLALNDADPAVQASAIAGLGRNGHSKAIVGLLTAAEQTRVPNVQYRAIAELYRKVGMTYVGKTPDRHPQWQRQQAFVVEWLKDFPQVQDAFAKAGQLLVRHPDRLIRSSLHDAGNRPKP